MGADAVGPGFLVLLLPLLLLLLLLRFPVGSVELLELLGLSAADVVRLPVALKRIKEFLQGHVALHEPLQQLL